MAEAYRDIVVIGASAGGVDALQRLAAMLPPDFPGSIFIVLHLWPHTPTLLAPILARAGPLPVCEAVDGGPIERGQIYVAPTDMHLMLERNRVRVVRGPKENRTRPAINPLFRSAASAYGPRVVGVVLTGMLDDGAAGLWAIKQCEGTAVVQADADYDDMPRSARENVEIDYDLPLREIAPLLVRLAREPAGDSTPEPTPEIVRHNTERAKMNGDSTQLDQLGHRSVFSCPDCGGAIWELEEGQLQFRCHVGHAFSPEALRDAQADNVEHSLWSALRALRESAMLDERLALRSETHGLPTAAASHRANAQKKREHADNLQRFASALGRRQEQPRKPAA